MYDTSLAVSGHSTHFQVGENQKVEGGGGGLGEVHI
jgi:hypothetical protein